MSIEGVGINADSKRINGRLNRFDRELKTLSGLGFDYIEIAPQAVDGILHGKLNPYKIDDILRIIGFYDVKYTVHGPDLVNLKDIEHASMQKNVLKASVDFSEKLNSKIVVYHLGSYIEGIGLYYEQRKKEIDSLKEIAEYASDKGIYIAIENTKQSAQEVVDTIKSVDRKNVGMTLDFGHLYLWAKKYNEDFLKEVEIALEYTIHIHIHDNFGEDPSVYRYEGEQPEVYRLSLGLGDLHMPMGWGDIPYDRIFELIRESGFSGVLVNEINSWERYFNAVKNLPDVTRLAYKRDFVFKDKTQNGYYYRGYYYR